MPHPEADPALHTLLQPVEPVAVSLPINHVRESITIHVIPDDWKTCVFHLPVFMPLPLALVRINLLKPPIRGEDVHLAVTVNVGHADAVPILLTTANFMHARLRPRKINPKHTRMVVVRKNQVRLAITVDVC